MFRVTSRLPNLDVLNRRMISYNFYNATCYKPIHNYSPRHNLHVFFICYPQSCGAHEIFLFQTEFFSLKMILIRIQNPGNIFGQVSIQNGLDIVSIVDCKNTKKHIMSNTGFYLYIHTYEKLQVLQNFKLNSIGDFADHNRSVLTILFPYPGTG